MASQQTPDGTGPSETARNIGPTKERAAIDIDTVHNDEATKILDTYDGDRDWTSDEEKRLRRRVDWRLLPILCVTYGLQYYDKNILSQAALFGLRQDLGLDVGERFSWCASIFYLGFLVGAYPVMLLAQRYPVERVASAIVTLWGLCLLLTTVCTNYQGVYAQRFFLGLLEVGISPMFMLIIGSWYKKNEQAMRMGIWLCCNGYVSMVSPLINYGLGSTNPSGSSWRLMFYFAGGMTIAWGILLLFILPADPIRAKGLEPRERYVLVARLRTNNSGVRNTHYKMNQALELAGDPKFWIIFSISFLCMFANAPLSTFVPLIVKGFGYSNLQSLLLFIPVGAWSGTFQLIFCYLAMTYPGIRTWLIFIAQMVTTLAALLLWVLPLSAKGALVFATCFLSTLGGGYVVLMGLQLANTAGYTKRSIASSGLYVGYCFGNFVGPLCFKKQDAPRYVPGFIVIVIASFVAGILAVVYRYVCIWDNRKRDKAGIPEGFDHAFEDDLTDIKNPQFRYVL
ncbi:hypothetical protein C2857_006217 [Epichloe festucae Fl1]|uniref:Major facilitator superfamily (MFS) profile domain-containing protein n=1 Tax=Epichloe festucae (strain Fl1) TaxID=877507 RepID=A0A7S9PUD3_EPIFF|nr:hypothetical protein C2857_006217 [Epichloe festucae Fl1]